MSVHLFLCLVPLYLSPSVLEKFGILHSHDELHIDAESYRKRRTIITYKPTQKICSDMRLWIKNSSEKQLKAQDLVI